MDNPESRSELELSDEASQVQCASSLNGAGGNDDPASKKAPVKKRTKTGCLTCRRRRIKCDEAKPTCNNCIKSKRLCDGYSQRVIFKDPIGAFHGGLYGPIPYPQEPDEPTLNAHFANFAAAHHHAQAAAAAAAAHTRAHTHAKPASQGPLPTIAPKPPVPLDFGAGGHHSQAPLHLYPQSFGQGSYAMPRRPGPAPGPSTVSFGHDLSGIPPHPTIDPHQPFADQFAVPRLSPTSPAHFEPQIHQSHHHHLQHLPSPDHPPEFSALHHQPAQPHFGFFEGGSTASSEIRRQSTFARVDDHDDAVVFHGENGNGATSGLGGRSLDSVSPVLAKDHHYWYSDDDASMADSDDEDVAPDRQQSSLRTNDLGILVARRLNRGADGSYATQVRTFSSHLGNEDVLASYHPSSTNSPLNDKQTAAVFWHFVNVTGASMSLYERHPFDPSPMFQGQPVPKARQHIWTYTFPILAFNHPALLQSMLALGSLQIATLQGVPVTASMKHYHLSLRRIAKNYRSPSKLTQSATMAATLLLGFYEVWNSDHEKWCRHLWGARIILKELPLRAMTKRVIAMRRKKREEMLQEMRREQEAGGGYYYHHNQQGTANGAFHNNSFIVEDPDFVDTQLLAEITGRPVSYDDDDGRVFDEADRQGRKRFTDRDLENYEHTVDLYWWYCKMDVYQSILGGTLLLMDYDHWTQVAPRAPIGRIDAIFGTFDHMMLLLGRLTDFASKDLARKRRSATAAGGRGGGPGQPGGGPSGPDRSPPPFAGMMPTTGQFPVPTGFSPPKDPATATAGEEMDMEESTTAALAEWESIRQAFAVFKQHLGLDFAAMEPEDFGEAPQLTPFGPAKKYRTFSIAGIWMNYYMGLILLYRAHPSMPPVAMRAAGMAAQQTAPYAVVIAQISAGLWEDSTNVSEVPTVVGAAFIESCFPMFVAGVQFQDYHQRVWIIQRLSDVSRLTGWQSAHQIATGCESAWLKAAAMGRGPPYERPLHLQKEAQGSVWNAPRRIDRRIRELDEEVGPGAGFGGPDGPGSADGGGGASSSGGGGSATGGGEHERRLVLAHSEQTHYALGLLGVEQDLARLDFSATTS